MVVELIVVHYLWNGATVLIIGWLEQLGSEKEIARLNASPTSNTVLKADSNGLLVDSLITDDGTDVTVLELVN